jgi:hypothetical protein
MSLGKEHLRPMKVTIHRPKGPKIVAIVPCHLALRPPRRMVAHEERGPAKDDQKYPSIHPDVPMIVWMKNEAFAISCDLCDANVKTVNKG